MDKLITKGFELINIDKGTYVAYNDPLIGGLGEYKKYYFAYKPSDNNSSQYFLTLPVYQNKESPLADYNCLAPLTLEHSNDKSYINLKKYVLSSGMKKIDSGEFDRATLKGSWLSGIWSKYEGKNYLIYFTVYIDAENKHLEALHIRIAILFPDHCDVHYYTFINFLDFAHIIKQFQIIKK